MKHIIIIGKTQQHEIFLEDDDSENLETYTKKLSSIFESKNVLIIHTTSGSVILRPSDIFAIKVYNDVIQQSEPELPAIQQSEPTDSKETTEDTLTD